PAPRPGPGGPGRAGRGGPRVAGPRLGGHRDGLAEAAVGMDRQVARVGAVEQQGGVAGQGEEGTGDTEFLRTIPDSADGPAGCELAIEQPEFLVAIVGDE